MIGTIDNWYISVEMTPREREAPIEMVDDFLATLQVSCFVAMYFANYDKLPCIGKVLAVEEDNFKVHYWKGTYCGKWTPQHVPRQKSRPWVEILPKSCIVCSSFELTEDNKLMPSTRKFLKERYAALRTNQSWVFSLTPFLYEIGLSSLCKVT